MSFEYSRRLRASLVSVLVLALPALAPAAEEVKSSEYAAMRFEPAEGWWGLDGKKLRFDFTGGAQSVNIGPRDMSLLGTPTQIRIRARGKAAGHPVRLRIATHFMTFEKMIGQFAGEGEVSEVMTAAPPGEGWRWYGGENDGRLHGPMRITGLSLDQGQVADKGELELIDIRVTSNCGPQQSCVMLAEMRDGAFVATVRSLAPEALTGSISWVARDWAGGQITRVQRAVRIPAGAEPVEFGFGMPAGEHVFVEAEATLDVAGQVVPTARAYFVAPVESQEDTKLDGASPFGMGLFLYRYPGHAGGLAEMDRAAEMGGRAGVKWSREEFGWARIEPRRGEFDWRFYDQVVATARRHGISVYGLLSYWSSWTKPYTKEGIEDYCKFAAVAADRYRKDIRHWEVWNEPNIFFWQGPRDMYAELLKQAYATIKKANPDALVLGCSTAGIDRKFIQRTMELGGTFDILTIHPYRSRLDDRGFIDELRRTAELAKRADGSTREVWITEMGWATNVPHNTMLQDFRPNTQRQQAQLLARSYIDAIASGASQNISWYDFRNDGTDPFNFEHNMGIITRDFRIKPAYRAYATMTRMLKGKRVEREIALGEGIIAYRFAEAGGQRPVMTTWSVKGERKVELEGKSAVTTDLMGGTRRVAAEQGKIGIALGEGTPVFIAIEE